MPHRRSQMALAGFHKIGATTDAADLGRMVKDADADLVGWMYWQWLLYEDPTGSHDSGLWPANAAPRRNSTPCRKRTRQVIAGTPTAMNFDQSTAVFHLSSGVDRGHSADGDFRPGVAALPGRLLHQLIRREGDIGGGGHTAGGDQRPVGLHR